MSDTEQIAFQRLNELPDDAFVQTLSDIVDGPPWAIEALVSGRPYSSVRALHGALVEVMCEASDRLQIRLATAHKQDHLAALPEHDEEEVEDADAEPVADPAKLLAAYDSRFGFPFLLAEPAETVLELNGLLEQRLANEPADERMAALREIAIISKQRLELLMRHQGQAADADEEE